MRTAFVSQLIKEAEQHPDIFLIIGDLGFNVVEEFAKKEFESSVKAMAITASNTINAEINLAEKDSDLVKIYDDDGDGKITKQEYLNGQSKIFTDIKFDLDNDGTVTEDEYYEATGQKEQWNTIASRMTNLFAQNLDFNGNGKIDVEELAFFNKNADSIDGKTDGIIKNAGESEMFNAVTGINSDNTEFNRVINKYLSGKTLTAEENTILKQSQSSIKKNMKNAFETSF